MWFYNCGSNEKITQSYNRFFAVLLVLQKYKLNLQGYRMKIFIVDLGLKTRIDKLMFLMPAVTNLRFRYRKRCQGKFHAIALVKFS